VSGGRVESDGHLKDFAPAALGGLDSVELLERDGAFVIEPLVLPEEVVVSDEEDGEAHGAIKILEATASTGMELVCAIQAFDQLLERSEVL